LAQATFVVVLQAFSISMYEEESIYKIIPPEAPVMEKQPMYRSKHSGKAPPSCSTFGLAQTSKPG